MRSTRSTRSTRCGLLVASLCVLVACSSLGARARADSDDGEAGRRVSFRVEAARDVESDWFSARAGITVEDPDPARAAERVNDAMTWALERARAADDVEARSGSYSTWPVREEGRIRRWRASHEMLLESGDAEALSDLLGTLQERLEVRSFDVSVSEERRARVERELVGEALAAFRKRAALVHESLGAAGYAIDQLSISTGGGSPPRPMMREFEADAHRARTAPAVEPGTTRIAVGVDATIALE